MTRVQTDLIYLRSYVVWCSTEGLGGDAIIHIFFTHAKVSYLNVALAVQHHIVQLQVSTGEKNKTKRHSINDSMWTKKAIFFYAGFLNLQYPLPWNILDESLGSRAKPDDRCGSDLQQG